MTYHAPEPVVYHAPEPVVYHEVEEVYPDDPPVYHYTYAVEDEYEGANHSAEEESDEYNNIHGSYQVITIDPLKHPIRATFLQSLLFLLCYCCLLHQVDHADGRSQHVEYISGDVSGYKANVEYR